MKQRALFLMLAVVSMVMLTGVLAYATVPFVVPVTVADDSGNVRTIAFGILTSADPCVNTGDSFGGYSEFELPPIPPTNVFDARFVDRTAPNGPVTSCYGDGSLVEFRPSSTPGASDTFYVKIQEGTGLRPIHLTWAAGLSSVADSLKIIDAVSDGTIYTVDMLAATNFDITTGLPTDFKIILYATQPAGVPVYFWTTTPDSLITKDPVKLKFWKPAKHGKGLAPNIANLLAETVIQGGFADSTSESDEAGGMVIGRPYMFLKDPVKKKWAPLKDSAAVHGWVRIGKFDQIKGVGKGYGDIQKTLEDKTGKHIGLPRGLDSTLNPGDLKRKPILKQYTKLVPKKQSNRLFAQLVALKVNIAASAMGKTPAGFGDLEYNMAGSPFDGMSMLNISAKIDTAMTHWQGVPQAFYDSAYACLSLINQTFVGSILDTAAWDLPAATPKLILNGSVDANLIPYVTVPSPFVPTRITVQNDLTDETEEFGDDDEDLIDGAGVPVAMKVYQNYPNPFNPATTLAFRLAEASNVTIKIYNLLGQEIAELLANEEMDEGYQTVEFTSEGLASGVYFYRIEGQTLESGDNILPVVGKMMLLK